MNDVVQDVRKSRAGLQDVTSAIQKRRARERQRDGRFHNPARLIFLGPIIAGKT
jgi:hypothetical protein